MFEKTEFSSPIAIPARRRFVTGAVLSIGALMVANRAGATPQQAMAHPSSSEPDKARTSLHQEIELKGAPQRIYEILLDSKQFAAFTGAPAEISREAGGTFSLFGGIIVGRNIELVPGQRIVQAWRPADWPAGLYSLVRFELKELGSQTILVLDHSSFPQGGFEHLSEGWKSHYWDPLKKFLA
jgi:activator of HSP90 ATPase